MMKLLGRHPFLCKLIKYDRKNKVAKLEYVKGNSLKTLIEQNLLSINEKIKIAYQILEICSYIHSKNIIHGDIHANQIIVDSNNNIKLIDFGFAYQINRLKYKKKLYITRGGVNYYIEPENILPNMFYKYSKYTPSFKSEVYRIGVLLYYLFYNQYPFYGITWKQLYANILKNKVEVSNTTPKSEVIPPVYINIIKRSLNKSPRLRFNSATDMFIYVNNYSK